ncbi:MAG: MBL fold metallo-hydrolase [archaeon]
MSSPISLSFPSPSIRLGVSTVLRTPTGAVAVDAGHFFDGDFSGVDAVILTHAHWDHGAHLAKILDERRIPIYCTPETRNLLRENPEVYRGRPDENGHMLLVAKAAIEVDYLSPFEIGNGITATLLPAGHLPGSAQAFLEYDGMSGIFSGDINTQYFGDFRGRPFAGEALHPNNGERKVDFAVTECTHAEKDGISSKAAYEQLRAAMIDVAEKGGRAVIAAPNFMRGSQAAYLARQILDEDEAAFRGYSLIYPRSKGLAFLRKYYPETYADLSAKGLETETGKKKNLPSACFIVCEDYYKFAGVRRNPFALINTRSAACPRNLEALESSGSFYAAPIPIHSGGPELVEYVRDWIAPGQEGAQIFLNHGRRKQFEAMRGRLIGEGYAPAAIHIPQIQETFVLRE